MPWFWPHPCTTAPTIGEGDCRVSGRELFPKLLRLGPWGQDGIQFIMIHLFPVGVVLVTVWEGIGRPWWAIIFTFWMTASRRSNRQQLRTSTKKLSSFFWLWSSEGLRGSLHTLYIYKPNTLLCSLMNHYYFYFNSGHAMIVLLRRTFKDIYTYT